MMLGLDFELGETVDMLRDAVKRSAARAPRTMANFVFIGESEGGEKRLSRLL